MPTLAEMRAQAPMVDETRPTRSLPVCTDQSALAAINRLGVERRDLLIESGRIDADGQPIEGAPKRNGEKSVPARVAEIDAETGVLWDRIRASQGTLTLRGFGDEGEWERWKAAHRPDPIGRTEIQKANGDVELGHPIYDPEDWVVSDEGIPLGFFNLAAVVADLAQWVHGWDDETLEPEEWDGWLSRRIIPGDKREAAILVVRMHEERVVVLPKSPSAPSPNPGDARA